MNSLENLDKVKRGGMEMYHEKETQTEQCVPEEVPQKHTNRVFIKAELKEEHNTIGMEKGNEPQSDDNSNFDSDLELSKVKNFIKSIKKDKDLQIKSFIVKSYTSTTVKEEPVDDFNKIFKENILEFEKLKFHQQIFEQILENSEQIKLKDLQAQYISHLHQAAKVEIFHCSFCPYQTINITNLKTHLMIIHNKKLEQKKYQCRICNFEDYQRTSMTLHVKLHKNLQEQTTYECQQCKYIAPSQRSLKNHLKKHNQVTKCDLCPFEATDGLIKKHMSTHKLAPNKYKCYRCEFEVAHKIKLARHLLEAHQIENECIQNIKKYKCPLCHYATDQRNRLKGHSLMHKSPEEVEHFYCPACPFKTKFKKSLQNHQITHEDPSKRVKTKMCEICSYKCNKPSDLRKHLITHKSLKDLSESEIFSCTKCSYKSKNKDNLKDHLLIHEAPQFTCNICGYQAKRKQNYKAHLLLHKKSTEISIYECPYCPYKSRKKERFKHHMKVGDHSGKNLKHIPHRFRVENTDREDFDPTAVRFGPPKKYPKYPKKNKSDLSVAEAYSWGKHDPPSSSSAAGDLFLIL